VAPATLSMVLRTIPTAKTAAEAAERVRGAWLWVCPFLSKQISAHAL